MSDFPALIVLSNLDGNNGFVVPGLNSGHRSGTSVASAGDVNGDGFDDFLIGAEGVYSSAGATYLVFGQAGTFGASFDLATLDGTSGVRLDGVDVGIRSGTSVASAGDLNGDGFDDLMIGAPNAAPGSNANAGRAFVVYGQSAFGAGIIPLTTLDGAIGFRLDGTTANHYSGKSVAGGGDFNGDGFVDMIIGAPGASGDPGRSYLVFGSATGFASSTSLGGLTGSGGALPGILFDGSAGERSGTSVAFIGDVNGDNLDDIVIGAPSAVFGGNGSAGSAYIVFGATSGFGATFDLSSLNGSNGFQIGGTAPFNNLGNSVASAGDINGDGLDDLIVGAYSADASAGKTYIVFGTTTAFSPTLDLTSLQPSMGFSIAGLAANDLNGYSVSSAGDVNGDGFDDLLISARDADPNGTNLAGESYVVFGKNGDFGFSFDLAALDGNNGFKIEGITANARSGNSVAAAGDINGDGFDDIIVGASRTGGGVLGASYIIYGQKPDAAVVRGGTDIAQTIRGGDFNDDLSGFGGADTLIGGAGNDRLDGGTGSDVLQGGAGNDNYTIDSLGDVIIETSADTGDVVQVSRLTSFTLAAGVRVETILAEAGSRAIALTGNAFNQNIFGNAGANTLDGAGGNDTLRGGAGNDTYVLSNGDDQITDETSGIDTITSTITRSIEFFSAIENLTLAGTSAANATGNGLLNRITGNSNANVLDGGDDTLIDVLAGGAGNDTYQLTNRNDTVSEAANAGTDTVRSTITRTLGANVENLILDGTTAINGTGNALANRITGNDGANTLSGGTDALADTLIGGAGNDIYVLANGTDTVTDTAGIDTITSTVTRSLASFTAIENLTLVSANINGTGNTLANVLTGSTGNNILDGGTGNDTLIGNAGNDTLKGGTGLDTLTGGTGSDIFVFNTALNATTNRDTITDFSNAGQNDVMHLENTGAGLFTTLAAGALNAAFFAANATGTATDADDRIIYNTATGALFYDSNGNAAGGAIQFATLTTKPPLTATDFFVI